MTDDILEALLKTVSTKQVTSALRLLGFVPDSRGNGTSMTVWADSRGRTCHVSHCRTDLHIAHLFRLGCELEGLGICLRRDFMAAVQSRNINRPKMAPTK